MREIEDVKSKPSEFVQQFVVQQKSVGEAVISTALPMPDFSIFGFTGLTSAEVAARTAEHKVNRADKFTTRTITGILRSNILTVFNGIILLSLVALVFIKAYTDIYFLAAVTVINTLAGIVEEVRAKLALDRLALLNRKKINVIREQKLQNIAVEEVVQDDLIAVTAGDQIIADGILLSAASVYVDESLLTGESDTIKKSKDHDSRLLSGSFCVGGYGVYQACSIGNEAHVNQLTSQAKAYKNVLTPIQKDINGIVEGLTGVMVLFFMLLLLANYIKGETLTSSVLAMVTVIKSFVPQGLILMSTLAFAFGAIHAAKRYVLVQKLNAIESMSQLTILCLDKTGTLGTNLLHLEKVKFLVADGDAAAAARAEIVRQLRLFVGAVSTKNRTLEAIEQVYAGNTPARVLEELPFLSSQKISAVRIVDDGGAVAGEVGEEHSSRTETDITLWLGAPEALAKGKGTLTEQHLTVLQELREQGLRVLAFASSTGSAPLMQENARAALKILAFIVLRDELRPNLAEAVKFYESRNVRLKILSGDHPETIVVLAKQAGMVVDGKLINGRDLDKLQGDELKQVIMQGQFFGNLTPQHKKIIINTLQEADEYVGMVGDGVNDILALKQANIGIAMNSGTAAARDVSDIILLKDDFTNLPSLSQEGDRIIYNIKRIARLFLTKNIYCLFFILFVGFVGLEFPLSPRFITWIDVLTLGAPTAVLMLMAPQLSKQETKNFLSETIKFAVIAGVTIAFFSLLVYATAYWFQSGGSQLYGKSAGVAAIIFMGLYLVYRVTAAERMAVGRKTFQRYIVYTMLIAGGIANLLAIYWPLSRGILGLVALRVDTWITLTVVAMLGVVVLRWLFRK
jgi:cation-transporting P-type ATPase E